jgi:hypothetical protein
LIENGFLLVTVVFVPFPTSLIGEHVLTDHAVPAVFLYNAIIAIQNGYFALIIYSLLAILALWFPLAVAIISTMTWIFWLIFGINMTQE